MWGTSRVTAPTVGAPVLLPGQNPGQTDQSSIPGPGTLSPINGAVYDPSYQAAHPSVVTGGSYDPNGNYTVPRTATPAPAPPDWSNPDTQLSTVTQWLQQGGFGGDDPNYWVGRINDTGGFTPQNLQYWQARIAAGPQGGQAGGAYYDPAAAGVTSPSPGGANTDPSAAVQNAPFLKAFQDALGGQLKTLTDPNSSGENDPNIKPTLDAYHVSNARNLDQERTALAEYFGSKPGLGHSGAFDQATQGAIEHAGEAENTFRGTTVANNNALRMNALANLLGIGNSQSGLSLQQQQGADSLGFNYASLLNLLNQNTSHAILNPTGGA